MHGSVHTVRVTGYAATGEGVARLGDGRVVFIRGAAEGDVCEISIVSERARSCRGAIVNILSPSPDRVSPGCDVYPVCGGCDFRHIAYGRELDAKLRRLNDALGRIGGLPARADEILATGQADAYRNKAVFHTATADGKTVIGFYRAASRDICPVGRCPLLRDELNVALGDLWKDPLRAGTEITLRAGANGIAEPVEEVLDGLVFRMSKTSFFQVNTAAALLLYRRARAYAGMSPGETLVDLYCGVGTLTLFVGRDAGRAIGVESDPVAVEDARKNAESGGFTHVEFIRADAAAWDADIHPDCVIVDPPRRGLSPGALRKVMGLAPPRIVYISCDPATLARDLRLLDEYEVREVCAVDMFPRTANVESCLLLTRK